MNGYQDGWIGTICLLFWGNNERGEGESGTTGGASGSHADARQGKQGLLFRSLYVFVVQNLLPGNHVQME